MPVPISLIIDDSCPLVHVYACHRRDVHQRPMVTPDGRPIEMWIPNEFLDCYCDIVERWGMAGKFSVVAMPGGLGDVVRGIEGYDPALTREWIETARRRLGPRWDFCCEGLTHNLAVNLETGEFFPESENAWSQHQDRSTLTPYLVKQLELLRDAGIDATGVTSPWVFGIQVEDEYIAAIMEAQRRVYGRRFSWYFLHMPHDKLDSRPHVAHHDADATLIHIPGVVDDFWWPTIDSPRTDREWVEELTDKLLTADGRGGKIRQVLDAGGMPVILTHWQSLFSNGLETGLAVLDLMGQRIHDTLSGQVEWRNFSEIARMTAAEHGIPIPD